MSISSNIRIYAAQDYAAMCRRGANILFAELIRNPHALLGLATGSSPIGIYDCLADWCNKGDISFRHCRTVNLDEYCGLSADHPQSYAYFMRKNLFDRVDICLENTHLPDGTNPDAAAECARYDALLEELGEMDSVCFFVKKKKCLATANIGLPSSSGLVNFKCCLLH